MSPVSLLACIVFGYVVIRWGWAIRIGPLSIDVPGLEGRNKEEPYA